MNVLLPRRTGWTRLALLLPLPWLLFAPVEAADPPCADCHDLDPAAFRETVHGFLDCLDCHDAEDLPHPDEVGDVDCSMCHEDVRTAYEASIHGRARGRGVEEAPGCGSCHGPVHSLVPASDPASPVHAGRLPETCGACHSDPEMVERLGIPIARPLEAYRESVHAQAVERGDRGPTCSDCHGSHAIFRAGDARSSVSHAHVPDTCGGCHTDIAARYQDSVHGVALRHGVREAPACTDCHGEHRILSAEQPGSPVYPTNIPRLTCGRCHADVRLAEKYGLPQGKVPAYQDSYHGLASRSGALTVAHCASCHGVHDIQPSDDPRSHVHPANLAETCGRCHPGAGERFTIGPVHIDPTESRFTAVYVVRWIYLPLIWLTVGGMLVHNLLDLRRKAASPRPSAPLTRGPAPARMPRRFRQAHGMTMVSFAVLVYTGFALKFPESWWAWPLVNWEAELGLRGSLHRAAAAVLLFALAFHLLHLALDRRARACIRGMRPGLEDLHELRERLRYYLGRRPDPPPAGVLGYIEKVEYLAFLWGMAVMAATGFLLWFETPALRWLPSWVSDVATAVHYYEAILASLAIAIWHLYWVIFDPVVYPMDWTWWTGIEPPARAAERAPAVVLPPAPPEKRPARRRPAARSTPS